jgi:diaminopimelate decarboxylase
MSEKKIPFSQLQIEEISKLFPTPFHIYDEQAIRANARRFIKAFSWAPKFQEYFAVKATPTPAILEILRQEGIGGDCSSLAELILCEKAGITGENIMLTSNDTPVSEFQKASDLGAIINLDDISHIAYLEENIGLPEVICFRYNPGPLMKNGNSIIGYPEEAKYGLTKAQIFEAYKTVRDKGVKRFGLHTMVVSNELDPQGLIGTANMMFDLAVEIYEKLGIKLEFINLGGGIGIPYQLDQQPVDLELLGTAIHQSYDAKIKLAGLDPLKLTMECGRMITGPYGYLVSRVIHKKDIYKNYVGLDACMANLMRPALYGSYHHITVVGKEQQPHDHVYDVTGSLCENNDKFAIDRALPRIDIGDLIVIHDAGAHGHAMGFNYNGKLRSAELLLKPNGTVKQIRRAETLDDYFATLDFNCPSTNLAAASKK